MKDLENKNIIVTGASGGIGNSIVEKLNECGANVLASGTRLEKLEELKSKFNKIKILKFDISQSDKIEEFIDNAANELGGLNCISPGFIKTAMTDKIDEKFKEVIVSKIPSARLGEPEDIANAVLFLSSENSNYINGETLHVNGGMSMA